MIDEDTQQSPTEPAKDTLAPIAAILADHHAWWWRVLWKQKAWEFFIPFPLPEVVRGLSRWYRWLWARWFSPLAEPTNVNPIYSSGWFTLAILLSLLIYKSTMHFTSNRLISTYAPDASKTLLTAAFLLGTILSVSVALPGQAVIKSQLEKDPEFVFDFMAPFMWALMWGVLGAVLLAIVYYLTPFWRSVAYCVAVYGAMMELNALVHTIRVYMIGIILYYRDEEKKKREKEAAIAEAKARSETDAKADKGN